MAKAAVKANVDENEVGGQTPGTSLTTATPGGAVAAQGDSFMDLGSYDGPMGTENIDREDVTIPRLKLGQGMSDEVKDGKLAEGDIFINVSGEIVWKKGDKPLPVVIVAQSKEYSLWHPRKDPTGDGIIARARPVMVGGVKRYRWDKPNEKFDVKTMEGKIAVTWETKEYVDQDKLHEWGSEIPGNPDSGPAATETHNYLLMLPTMNNAVVAVALARSGVKVARNLNAIIKMGPPRIPLFLRRFTISSVEEVGGGGDRYANWSFAADGCLVDDAGRLFNNDDKMLASMAKSAFDQFSKGMYTVDQSDNAAREGGGGKAGGTEDEIPF